MKSKLLLTLALLAFAPILAFSQTYQPYQNPHVQFFAGSAGPLSAGAPAAGYKLCTYAAGTTTPQVTYSNNSGSVNTNPVVLDSSGYGTIYLNGALSYKFILLSAGTDSTCANGTQQWLQDQITGLNVGALTLAGNLIWSVDSTYDIGALGASRPRDFYLGRNAFIGGNVTWSTDNSFDIGASAANRPRDIYLGRNFKLGGTILQNGSSSGGITFQTQAATGTYNFNWPTTAGSSGQPMLSAGGGSSPMTFGTLGTAAGGTGQTVASLFPSTAGSVPIAISCGSIVGGSGSCSPSNLGNTAKVEFGTCTFSAGTTCSVSSLPFAGSSTYGCTVTDSSGTGQTYQLQNTSASQITITSSTSTSRSVSFLCIGQ